MSLVMVEKVRYRLPGSSRLVWAAVLAQREGLTLLWVRVPNGYASHFLCWSVDCGGPERIFEASSAPHFLLEQSDMLSISRRLAALGEGLAETELSDLFLSGDDA